MKHFTSIQYCEIPYWGVNACCKPYHTDYSEFSDQKILI